MAYLPPYYSLRAMITESAKKTTEPTIAISEPVLRALLQMALEATEFDEANYLRENPDVAVAIGRGLAPDAREHYVKYGYFEGRSGGVTVDATWYLRKYPDVAQAIRTGKGKVRTALEHFHVAGAVEGRSPNAKSQEMVMHWLNILGA